MGTLDLTMYKSTSLLFCLLILWVSQCQAKPGLWNMFQDCGDKQHSISWQSNQCAKVFDDDDCGDDGLMIEVGETSFSRTTLNLRLISWRNEIDAIITRRGCELTAYKDSDCTGDSKVVQEDDKIKCIRCRC